jgi:parallel beta-helix repeat protein
MKSLLVVSIICSLAAPAALLGQGALTPPAGAPAPSMKSLQQVEPRIDVQNAPAAAVTTTNAGYHYVINLPGSYYLSGNLGLTKVNGILINTAGVTLDLNGFEISRTSGSGGDGITIAATAHRASVRNGSLRGTAFGVRSVTIINPDENENARGCGFRDLTVSNFTNTGLELGSGAVVESCRVQDGNGNYGIRTGAGSSLSNCTATNNAVIAAFAPGSGSSLENCSAFLNKGEFTFFLFQSSAKNCSALRNRADSAAIVAEGGSTLTNCTASSNTSSNAVSAGISAAESLVVNCAARNNKGDGIRVSSGSIVRDNIAVGNGLEGDGAGIVATGPDNRIEGNNVSLNDRGVQATSAGNIIVRNSVSGNTLNWHIANANVILVVNATPAGGFTGNSGGSAPGTADPNANFTY